MHIESLFTKKLGRSINGVVKAEQSDDLTVFQELDEYVVTNELEKHFRTFFESYAVSLSDPSIANRMGVWISGFFGSGKSHFLKALSYLLANIEVSEPETGKLMRASDFFGDDKLLDGITRANVDKATQAPAEVILFNIDSKANAADEGNPILNVFLRVFNEYQGFSGDHPHLAHMERYLTQKGVYENFKSAFAASTGSSWEAERDGYHFSQDEIEQALSQALGISAEAANKWFEESETTFSVTVEKFCQWVRDYVESKGAEQRIIFMVDEVGQYIGSDTKLMLTLQTLTENLGSICKGRAWVVVTSQADMDAVLGDMTTSKANDFSKIAGRFVTRLSLSSSNSDEVIQKRLLSKTSEAEEALRKTFALKGDILRNQLTFDRSGPTLKNFEGPDSFVRNYPFAPYHFQLVQKVFEEIRKVGATGAHLAYGERSMLDAFQLAALQIKDQDIGALVPMYHFYKAIEGFLDTAVKRTIDQAEDNPALVPFDTLILRTLFMIRYVDLIKGTLDNLVTLCITRIDDDRLKLRSQIEASLQRLEKENLVTRNGEDHLFLTNEERDINRKIKNTELSSADENKELATLIFRDALKDINKYRYPFNKSDYSLGRYLDGHSLDGRFESDLRLEIISPLDDDYGLMSEGACIGKSTDAGGQILIKMPDEREFFDDLRTWLKTQKYIRLTLENSESDVARILQDRNRENQERRKRLRVQMEELLLDAEVYALGQKITTSTSNLQNRVNDACEYLLENTYSKLKYLSHLQPDPMRELKAVLTMDDISQSQLDLDGDEGNKLALEEVEQYIAQLASGHKHSLLVSDLLERFTKRPYGWPDAEVLLLLGRLAAAGRLDFRANQTRLPFLEAFDYLDNSRKRKEISVQKKRRTDDAVLRQARNLTQDLFHALGPQDEKALFQFYQDKLGQWQANLSAYLSKAEVGSFPGLESLKSCINTLRPLVNEEDSFEFFKLLQDNKGTYLDLEEDYRDLHEFFSRQLPVWQQLQAAILRFNRNQQALDKEPQAQKGLAELKRIAQMDQPYGQLHLVNDLIAQVEAVNSKIIEEKRQHAHQRIDGRIHQLQADLERSGIATPELSNQLLLPLQQLKQQLDQETSIADIHLLHSSLADEKLDEALQKLEQAVATEQKRQQASQQQPPESPTTSDASTAASPNTKAAYAGKEDAKPASVKEPVAAPKPVMTLSPAQLLSEVQAGLYLETQEEVEAFTQQLKAKLDAAIQAGQRVRIR